MDLGSGIIRATLHNCSIGDNVLIENISNHIANYNIGHDCIIQNVNIIVTEGISSFGNGTLVAVLNETGGRELMSMGMMMLPPTTISMPFKILLFVLADGWNLVIVNLVKTFM